MNCATSTRESWIEASRESGFGLATVVSGSMSPVLNVGDKVYVKFSDQINYRIGDVVVFPTPPDSSSHCGKNFNSQGNILGP
jgi:signal peptidase I